MKSRLAGVDTGTALENRSASANERSAISIPDAANTYPACCLTYVCSLRNTIEQDASRKSAYKYSRGSIAESLPTTIYCEFIFS